MSTLIKETDIEDLRKRARRIKLLLMDCDGVLTDGRLYYSEEGEKLKVFHVRDGQGIVSWHQAGFISGIISGRNSKIVKSRATELGVSYVKQSSLDKISDFNEILVESKVSTDETAFIGDDIADIELLKIVGFSAAVADAATEVLKVCKYKTSVTGGYGAVREVIDFLLASKK